MGIALVVVAVIGATASAFFSTRNNATPAKTTTTTISRKNLSAAARELVDLLDKERSITFHAVYTATSPDVRQSGIRLETWQSPPRVRQDSSVSIAGQAAQTSSYVLPSGAVRCTKVGSQPWSCKAVPPGQPSGADPITDAAIEQLRKGTVSARDSIVNGRAARCFTLSSAGTSSELCVTSRGIPVRVSAGGSKIEISELTSTVSDDVFTPPVDAAPA